MIRPHVSTGNTSTAGTPARNARGPIPTGGGLVACRRLWRERGPTGRATIGAGRVCRPRGRLPARTNPAASRSPASRPRRALRCTPRLEAARTPARPYCATREGPRRVAAWMGAARPARVARPECTGERDRRSVGTAGGRTFWSMATARMRPRRARGGIGLAPKGLSETGMCRSIPESTEGPDRPSDGSTRPR